MLLTGARHALAPVLDIARDPRWGRIEETYGEDPYLATVLGCAYIEALQGPDLADGVLATAKHMVGHGLAEGGRNQAPAHVGQRELRNEQLLPFEAAIRHAGIASVMPAYCDVDGVPCHASHELLTTILRDEWGFDGLIASDYMGVEMIATAHRLTASLGEAARLALAAGVDAELPRTVAFGEPLAAALADGTVDEALLDGAVGRVLRMKLRLGLFDRPYVEVPTDGAFQRARGRGVACRPIARRARLWCCSRTTASCRSRRSIRRLAVVGPIADSARELLGDYSHLVHMETLKEMRTGVDALGVIGDGEVFEPGDELTGRRTILDALRGAVAGAEVVHARGTGISSGTDEELASAVEAARDADVAIVVLGERSGLTDDSTTGEFRDRVGLGFLGRQQELLEAVVATGTPVVLVVVSGRTLALPWAAEHCAAILLAWVPGDAGPDAIADVLTGAVNPGGKLPVSMPRDVGQLPLSYRHHPTGGHSHPKGDYVDSPVSPLWPFGFGRSYTTFGVDRAPPRPDRALDGRRRGDDPGGRHEHRRGRRRRGRPALPPGRGGLDRTPGPRAARIPAGPARARRVPDGRVPPVHRAALLRRRGPSARRRARARQRAGRHLLRRPAADRRAPAARAGGGAGGTDGLPDVDDDRIGDRHRTTG